MRNKYFVHNQIIWVYHRFFLNRMNITKCSSKSCTCIYFRRVTKTQWLQVILSHEVDAQTNFISLFSNLLHNLSKCSTIPPSKKKICTTIIDVSTNFVNVLCCVFELNTEKPVIMQETFNLCLNFLMKNYHCLQSEVYHLYCYYHKLVR